MGQAKLEARVAALEKRVAALEGATMSQVAQPPVSPDVVTDLKVTNVTGDSATLSFTEVDDGTGKPSNYAIRYAPAPMSWGAAKEIVVMGEIVGKQPTVTIAGLISGKTYQFQVAAFRGTLNKDAVFGKLSSVASWTVGGVS